MRSMDLQDILKNILNAADSSCFSPPMAQLWRNLAISSTKEDPIDRWEACNIDFLDFEENYFTTFIRHNAVFFFDPDSCCEAIRCAIAARKLQVHMQANLARQQSHDIPIA